MLSFLAGADIVDSRLYFRDARPKKVTYRTQSGMIMCIYKFMPAAVTAPDESSPAATGGRYTGAPGRAMPKGVRGYEWFVSGWTSIQ